MCPIKCEGKEWDPRHQGPSPVSENPAPTAWCFITQCQDETMLPNEWKKDSLICFLSPNSSIPILQGLCCQVLSLMPPDPVPGAVSSASVRSLLSFPHPIITPLPSCKCQALGQSPGILECWSQNVWTQGIPEKRKQGWLMSALPCNCPDWWNYLIRATPLLFLSVGMTWDTPLNRGGKPQVLLFATLSFISLCDRWL